MMTTRVLFGILIGGAIGLALGKAGRCSTGTCPFTSNPYATMVLGAALGMALATSSGPRASGPEVTSPYVTLATKDTFTELVGQGPALVDFTAAWCGWCHKLAPIVAKLAEEYHDRVAFVKVDVDRCRGIARQYRVEGLPTIILFDHGKPAGKPLEGFRDEAALRKAIEELLKNHNAGA